MARRPRIGISLSSRTISSKVYVLSKVIIKERNLNAIKNIIFIILILIFSIGCIDIRNLPRYSGESNENYEKLVNKIEKNMQKCFEIEQKGILVGQYIIRENFIKPKYTKLTLYIENRMFGTIKTLATITIFDKEKVKVHINHRKLPFEVGAIKVGDLKKWYLDGMECQNEKK